MGIKVELGSQCIDAGDCCKEVPSVVVLGMLQHVTGWAGLHDLSMVKHENIVADVLHHREIVGNEEKGDTKIFLKILKQVYDLRLDADIEGADWLVTDE